MGARVCTQAYLPQVGRSSYGRACARHGEAREKTDTATKLYKTLKGLVEMVNEVTQQQTAEV